MSGAGSRRHLGREQRRQRHGRNWTSCCGRAGRHPFGGKLKLDAVAIDSSDSTDTVYGFCFPRAGRRILAIKGVSGSRPSIVPSATKMKGGGRLWIVGVDTIKQTIFNKLASGKGIRFSQSLEPVYYEHLSSERRVVRYTRGQPVRRFERITGKRAEALDALIYAFAARSAAPVQLDQREDELRMPVPPPTPPSVIRSRWMNR